MRKAKWWLVTLGAVVALAALAVARKPLRHAIAARVETRDGLLLKLEVPEGTGAGSRAIKAGSYCVLVHTYTPTGDEVGDRYWGSDGLDSGFCWWHSEQLNRRIRVVGVRVEGDAIGQDCTNRSCFDAVMLPD